MLAPTFNTGLTDVPSTVGTSASTVTTLYLYGADFANRTSDPIAVTLTDAAGTEIVPAKDVPPHDVVTYAWALKPINGLKWGTPSTGVTGQIWGYLAWPL